MGSMFKAFCFLLVGVFSTFTVFAQWNDSLVNKPYHQRIGGLYKYYSANHKAKDTILLNARIQHIHNLAVKHNDKALEVEALFMKALAYNYDLYHQTEKSIQELKAVAEVAIDNDYAIIIPKIYRRMGELYWQKLGNYEMAFESYFKMLAEQGRYSNDECPDIGQNFGTLGEAYFSFKDYTTCKYYMDLCLRCSKHPFSDKSKNKARNAIGLCFQEEGQLDSADFYFKQILGSTEEFKLAEWKGIAKGNLACSEIIRKNYDHAMSLLQENINESILSKDTSLLSHLYAQMAACYLSKGDISQATTYANTSLSLAQAAKAYSRLEDAYRLLAKLYMEKGQGRLAQVYFDSTLIVKDSLERQFSGIQLSRVNQKIDKQKQEHLEYEKKNKTLQRNFLLVLLMLILGAVSYIYINQKKKYAQEKLISELQLQQKDQALSEASIQLDMFSKSISEKNDLLDMMEIKLGNQVNEEVLTELQQHVILTDRDWEDFRALFDQVHKGYLIRLKSKLPELSPAEIRFMTLAKLQLSTKEMASTLGVSVQSIRVTRHRLLKKINLPEEGSLEDLVNSI